MNPKGQVSSFKTLDMRDIQSSAMNLTNLTSIKKYYLEHYAKSASVVDSPLPIANWVKNVIYIRIGLCCHKCVSYVGYDGKLGIMQPTKQVPTREVLSIIICVSTSLSLCIPYFVSTSLSVCASLSLALVRSEKMYSRGTNSK